MGFCPKCNTSVSKMAKFCPKCGAAVKSKAPYIMVGVVTIVFMAGIIGILKVFSGGGSSSGANSTTEEKLTETEKPPLPAENTEASAGKTLVYVVNCKESITLRTDADTKADEICQIPLGTAVEYLETSSDKTFYKVTYNDQTGYALANYLADTQPNQENSDPAASSENSPDDAAIYTVANCKESITLRKNPNTQSEELCQIPLGASVSYIEDTQKGFYKISYNGLTGYVLSKYLS